MVMEYKNNMSESEETTKERMASLKGEFRETDLFQRINVLLLEKNKKQLEELKDKLSLIANVEVDNSAIIRGMIQYLMEHPDKLNEIAPYVKNAKGFNILQEFQTMLSQNTSLKEIEKRLGINIKMVRKNIEGRSKK